MSFVFVWNRFIHSECFGLTAPIQGAGDTAAAHMALQLGLVHQL